MMSLWDALRMNMMISYQELVRTFPNYWRKHNSAISAVIYNDDGLDVANEKIRQLFIGRYLSFTRGNTLTQMEFTIMGYMVSGYNPYQIAEVLDMDIRSIYAYKQRIEKRMGGKINELFIRSHSVQH
ncbi:helix-turn-helix transcriptional regulator, partial [Escherichia coli]|uniref:helix-turn-helix transcriptional regulator n=1 Tax=Escherichia coli TaxID=562 RepID=UPI003CE58EB5